MDIPIFAQQSNHHVHRKNQPKNGAIKLKSEINTSEDHFIVGEMLIKSLNNMRLSDQI